MRKGFSALFLFALGLWGVSQGKAASICDSTSGNIVTNCGFESGSFSGWSVTGNLYGGINGNYVGVDNGNPNSGNYESYFGALSQYAQNGDGTGNKYGPVTTLSQTLAALPGQYYEVSFYLDNNGCSVSDNPGCGAYYNYFDAYFDGALLTKQFNLPYSGSYDEYVFVLATTAGAGAYNPDGLQFDFTNDDDLFYFDDVTVTSLGATPEPASFLLVAPVLGGLWLARRRRKK
jgi:uncharacterized protein (TIGR03382 family)